MKKEYMMMFALTVAAGVAVFLLTQKMRNDVEGLNHG